MGAPASARGRRFRVVFVPGLAERVFPQRLREDALLLDRRRRALDASLPDADSRADDERLQLCLAVGAATERIHLSYPRIEVGESRPRVPSFYVLDVMRAVTGSIRVTPTWRNTPRAEGRVAGLACARQSRSGDRHLRARSRGAPAAAEGSAPQALRGAGRYLIQLNEALRRSVTERWARWQPRWHTSDGIIR